MSAFKTWQEMLIKTSYGNKDKYDGLDIYPNTGNIKIDYRILIRVINILSQINKNDIYEYFAFLSLVKDELSFTPVMNELDKTLPEIYDFENEETKNFHITGNIGSIVYGYNLIISKEHVLSMSALDSEAKEEYIKLIEYKRDLYEEIYGIKPIIFEHGSNNQNGKKVNSIDHAHTHIVNHRYCDEEKIVKELNLKEVFSIEEMLEYGKDKNYISYISPDGRYYIGQVQKEESQIMRKYIAEDIGKENEWDWKKFPHLENCFNTNKRYFLYKKYKQK